MSGFPIRTDIWCNTCCGTGITWFRLYRKELSQRDACIFAHLRVPVGVRFSKGPADLRFYQMPHIHFVKRPVRQFFNACLISIFCLHPVWADDTEIFFGPVSGSDAQPNIVFLLDASASMDFYDCANGKRQFNPCNDDSEFGDQTRLDRMNAALTQILNAVEKVNIGVMRFSNRESGSRVIYPVRDVEQDLCDGIPCHDNSDYAGAKSTVRQELMIDVSTSMVMQWITPTVGGLIEAARYYTGEPVLYGKQRWLGAGAAHNNERGEHSRVSHPASYTGGDLYRDPNGLCTDADLSDPSCSSERIDGSPVYISPIKHECQENHLIVIADGASNTDTEAFNRAKTLTGGNDTRYYEAESTGDLVQAVLNIVKSIDSTDSTLVAPGAAIDQFSRLSHREELYLSLFKPSSSPGWQGNLKRYALSGDQLIDANKNPAVGADGAFLKSSQSYWTGYEDGADIAIGGAAAKIDHATRTAVTYTGTQAALFHEDNELSSDNDMLNLFLEGDAVNVAPLGTASQSSISHNGFASRGKDNNTNGNWNGGSVTHTNGNSPLLPWWQLTLASQTNIERIVLHNRINCCLDRLNNVHVFVSKTPFGNATLEELIADSSVSHQYLDGVQGATTELTFNTTGQYVRVQLAQTGILSLAEVQVFGQEAALLAEKENLIDWIRGKDVKDENNNQSTTDNRMHMGDPLHSTSVTVNYGGDAKDPDSVVFVGTNEGYLHAISSRTGTEEFAFMPEPLMANIETLYNNNPRDDKVYGMDGDLTLWVKDVNGNGIVDAGVDSGEHAYLYAGMRRGGEKYYALNVTDRDNPQFLFSIPEVAPAAFAELGQSRSCQRCW